MTHEDFVKLVEKKFAGLGGVSSRGSPQWTGDGRIPSVYRGGLRVEERTLKEPFVKVAIAFEIGGWHDDQLVAACVLQQLLGGGSSFSAGGPGKGMYTRLYTEVLNREYWAESVEAFLSIHDSSGLFGIDGACPPEAVQNLMRVIIEQLSKLGIQR